MLRAVSIPSVGYIAPMPTGNVLADSLAMQAWSAAMPAGAVLDFPANQTYTIYPNMITPKAGQLWRLNGSTLKRAAQVTTTLAATLNNGDSTIKVQHADINKFIPGMGIAITSSDRSTGWSAAWYQLISVDTTNDILTLTNSTSYYTNVTLVNNSGAVASLPAGTPVYVCGYMFGTRNVAKSASTDTYVIPVDPTTLANTNLIVAGATLTGVTSGDTATVVSYTKDRIYVTAPVHSGAFSPLAFTQGETLQISSTTVASALPNYVPGVTRAMGTYPFPGIRLQDAVFDGNKASQTANVRWEHMIELDWVASDSWVRDVWIKNSAGEGMLVGGRNGFISNYRATDLQGNGIHFGDVDAVTGCWDWTVVGVDIDGAAKDSLMGHNNGCVTYSNNTRNIRGSNAVFANAGGSGNTLGAAIGGIDSYDNSETSWINWKAYNCAGGAFIVNPPITDARDTSAKFATLYDVHFAHFVAVNCGKTRPNTTQFGGNFSGDNLGQSYISESSVYDGTFVDSLLTINPLKRCKVAGVKMYSSGGFGAVPCTINGLIDSSTEIEVTEDTSGNGYYLITYGGTQWDNFDLNNTARGGSGGIFWGQVSSIATGTPIFRAGRSRSKAIDNFQAGHTYSFGGLNSAQYGNLDIEDSVTVGRWSPPSGYLGIQPFNSTSKTSPGWITFKTPTVALDLCAPAGGSSLGGGVVNYTVSSGSIATVTTNTNGSGYTAGTYYLQIVSGVGRPAIVRAVLSGTDLSTATYTVLDGGNGFGSNSTASFIQNGGINYTLTNGVVTGVTTASNGAGYTASTYYVCIYNPNGKPAIVKAVLSGTDLSTATYTIVDGGSGFAGNGVWPVATGSVFPCQVNSSQQNIKFLNPQFTTNGNRAPFSFGSSLSNVYVEGGHFDNAGWSVPSTAAPKFLAGVTPGNRGRASVTPGATGVGFVVNTLADTAVIVVTGGTVTNIELSFNQGGTWDSIATSTSSPVTVTVPSNTQMRLTYTVAPTVLRFGA